MAKCVFIIEKITPLSKLGNFPLKLDVEVAAVHSNCNG